MTSGLLAAVSATLLAALPPPPKQVVLSGRGTFGEVHLDHEAHLARRISCASCHGPGPVHRPELTPALAHETCRACHMDLKRGPTSCRDCHRNVKGDATATATPTATPTRTEIATPPPTVTVTATVTRTRTATATARSRDPESLDPPFRRSVHAGFAFIGGSARSGPGVGVEVKLEQDAWVAETEVDWTNRAGAQRTLALVGGGMAARLGRTTRVRAVALAGLDAGAPAYLLPSVGARIGIESRRRRAGFSLVPSADAALAVVSALGSRMDRDGARTGELALVFSLRLGWDLPAP
jgi:hypothetical protein